MRAATALLLCCTQWCAALTPQQRPLDLRFDHVQIFADAAEPHGIGLQVAALLVALLLRFAVHGEGDAAAAEAGARRRLSPERLAHKRGQ